MTQGQARDPSRARVPARPGRRHCCLGRGGSSKPFGNPSISSERRGEGAEWLGSTLCLSFCSLASSPFTGTSLFQGSRIMGTQLSDEEWLASRFASHFL